MIEHVLDDAAQLGEEGIVAMRRLNRRFAAFGGPSSFPLLANAILPVSVVDRVLQRTETAVEVLDLTGAGAAHIVGYTVPQFQRFTFTHYMRGASTGSTRMEVVLGGVRIPIEASGTASLYIISFNPFELRQGDTIGMLQDNNGADTAVSFTIIGQIETAF